MLLSSRPDGRNLAQGERGFPKQRWDLNPGPADVYTPASLAPPTASHSSQTRAQEAVVAEAGSLEHSRKWLLGNTLRCCYSLRTLKVSVSQSRMPGLGLL